MDTNIVLAAAALERGMRVYSIAFNRNDDNQPTSARDRLALSFLEPELGQLVICERDGVFVCAKIEREVESYDLTHIANCKMWIVGLAHEAEETARELRTMRNEAVRKIALSEARAMARNLLQETGLDAATLITVGKESLDEG